MAWQHINELTSKDALFYVICGIDAVDIEKRLCLSTTNGRTRNARRWFVHQLDEMGRKDWDAGKITFRAWTLNEALLRLNEPGIQKRIEKRFNHANKSA